MLIYPAVVAVFMGRGRLCFERHRRQDRLRHVHKRRREHLWRFIRGAKSDDERRAVMERLDADLQVVKIRVGLAPKSAYFYR